MGTAVISEGTPEIVAPRARTVRRSGRRHAVAAWAFVAPALAYVLIFFGYPIVNNVVMSFQEFTTKSFYTGDAPFVGLQNYAEIIGSELFVRLTVNTAVFTVLSLATTFAIGLALALFFNRRFRLGGLLRSLLLLPWLLPLIVSAATWRRMMEEGTGILNEILTGVGLGAVPWLTSPNVALIAVVIVNVWVGIPFVMVLLYGGLQEIPKDLYEAAALDGATGPRAFRYVTWPLLRPVVVVVVVLGFVYTIRVLDVILALTGGGPADATATYAIRAYQLSFMEFQFGQGAALSNILIVVSLAVAAWQLRSNRRASDLAG
jgi:multiple sugar transport system permease protein